MIFQKRLKELRNAKGVSQVAIADILGITDCGYRKYEAGDNEPTMFILIALANYFGVSLDYLTGRTNCPYLLDMDQDGDPVIVIQQEKN